MPPKSSDPNVWRHDETQRVMSMFYPYGHRPLLILITRTLSCDPSHHMPCLLRFEPAQIGSRHCSATSASPPSGFLVQQSLSATCCMCSAHAASSDLTSASSSSHASSALSKHSGRIEASTIGSLEMALMGTKALDHRATLCLLSCISKASNCTHQPKNRLPVK
jgi:hypothetical protein